MPYFKITVFSIIETDYLVHATNKNVAMHQYHNFKDIDEEANKKFVEHLKREGKCLGEWARKEKTMEITQVTDDEARQIMDKS